MKTAAVICEYNPFHNGHRYMLETVRKTLGADRIVCIMSGNFVQRGEPAILDKQFRTECALLNGADLVLELPAEFATASAGDFARCGVAMLLATGVCTHLCFGLEENVTVADLDEYRHNTADDAEVRERLKQGMTYPQAVYGSRGASLPGPNALLACEYLNALETFDPGHRIEVFPVTRSGDPYLSETASGGGFASAASIRRMLLAGDPEAADHLPCDASRQLLCDADMLSDLLNDRLLRESDLECYQDVSREIADRLMKRRYVPMRFTERVDDTKTRQYTRSRISRALLHIILGIRKDRVAELKEAGYVPYFRVLGYRTDSNLLAEINRTGDIPVYTKNARFYEAFPDVLYYDQIWHNLTGTGTELTRSPVIL